MAPAPQEQMQALQRRVDELERQLAERPAVASEQLLRNDAPEEHISEATPAGHVMTEAEYDAERQRIRDTYGEHALELIRIWLRRIGTVSWRRSKPSPTFAVKRCRSRSMTVISWKNGGTRRWTLNGSPSGSRTLRRAYGRLALRECRAGRYRPTGTLCAQVRSSSVALGGRSFSARRTTSLSASIFNQLNKRVLALAPRSGPRLREFLDGDRCAPRLREALEKIRFDLTEPTAT
jgi:hypothetical protein